MENRNIKTLYLDVSLDAVDEPHNVHGKKHYATYAYETQIRLNMNSREQKVARIKISIDADTGEVIL